MSEPGNTANDSAEPGSLKIPLPLH